MTRTAPLNFTNNSAIAAEADSGSGTAADPYVIEYRLIECNYSGSGINFENTTAHTIIRHCEINESGGVFGADASVMINNATNIQLVNVTLTDSGTCNTEIIYSTNVTIYNSTLDNASYYNICTYNNTNLSVYNSILNDSIYNIYLLGGAVEAGSYLFDSCNLTNASPYEIRIENVGHYNYTFNNMFINSSNSVHDFYLENVVNMTINNSNLYALNEFCIQADNMTNFTLENTHFNSSSNSNANEITNSQNVTFRNNTFNGTATTHALRFRNTTASCYYNNFSYEHASGYTMLDIGDYTNLTLQYNYVYYRDELIAYTVNDNVSISHNFYHDYFDVYPHAVLVNTSANVLNETINVTGAGSPGELEDLYPEYYRNWFPRNDSIYINLYSSFDYLGVNFDLVKIYVNDNLRVRREMSCEYIVYTVKIYDFAGRSLYANSFNVNESTDLDIALSIVTLSITNNFNYSVLFNYEIENYTITVPIGPQETYNIRVSIGSLIWWVTDEDGDILEDESGDDYYNTENVTGQKSIEFGWVTTEIATGDTITYEISILDYVLMLSILGAVIASVFAVAFKLRTTKTRSRRSSGSRKIYNYNIKRKSRVIRF